MSRFNILMLLLAVAVPYPQEAADPSAAVPGADGLTADLRHHHGHNSGGYMGPDTTKDTVDTTRDIDTTTTKIGEF
ncbi:hypothetical protein DAPPUDRAFT_325049 [Daphnia pulex]|uniref:Secreted protein n=1 Tax=Daphnia pulex TaxID=6669 RepID=E9H3J9_DAPPU|nr:hypothetical protein DAPPUDRAFT_325049 [Daphnia pulex]|eukprot:EFX73688.1 hypothetical protein DAPPUDRAFT_325049 [Daphnia pulex]